jgi:hypothetical protein
MTTPNDPWEFPQINWAKVIIGSCVLIGFGCGAVLLLSREQEAKFALVSFFGFVLAGLTYLITKPTHY